MSAKSHKSEYTILAVLGIFSGLVIMILVSWGWLKTDHQSRAGIRTSFSTNVDGVIIYYTLMERLGMDVERSQEILSEEMLDRAGVLVLLDPIIPIQTSEVVDIKNWVSRGGVLITTDMPPGFAEKVEIDYKTREAGRRVERKSRRRTKKTFLPTAVTERTLPLARDVEEVCFELSAVIEPDEGGLSKRKTRAVFADE